MLKVERGSGRRSNPDVFLSHSSRDKALALRLATDLNFCGVDACSWGQVYTLNGHSHKPV